MKALPRSGWLTHGVSLQDVESIADHSFSVCAFSMLLADMEKKRGVDVDVERVLRMAILHDMSESLTFDISKAYLEYLGKRGAEIKVELEGAAWEQLARGLNDSMLKRNYTNLQTEFDEEATVEAGIVHTADALDILLQVIDYRKRGYPEPLLLDLWNGTNNRLSQTKIQSVRELRKMLLTESKRIGSKRKFR
jgi:putative hydrolase of HD superfamily